MESGRESQGDGHSRGIKYPSWNRRSLHLQRALMFVIITTHFQWAASKRNENITVGSLGPWDKALLKIQGRCSDFHLENASTQFFYWPEDDPDAHFDYCCESKLENLKLRQYTYGIHGPELSVGWYYDLGLIDQCLPYWKCNHLFQTYFQTNLFKIYCETTDLRKLYKRRFLDRTVLKHGLLESAIPLIVTLEILVIFFVALYWCVWRRPVNGSRPIVKDASGAWFRHIRNTLLFDWTHLCLLTIIGNGLIEAVARQAAYSTQSKAFYNYARLYVVLSILVWYSSVLQQVAYALAEIEMFYEEAAKEAVRQNQAATVPNAAPPATLTPRSLSHQPSLISALEVTLGLNDDWKWQPIGAQVGILFCLWGFLSYSAEETTTGAVFGIIVSAACPWSGLYASKVIVCAFPWLLRRVHKNLVSPLVRRPQNYQGLWRSVLHLQQWRGHGRQGGSTEFVELMRDEPIV